MKALENENLNVRFCAVISCNGDKDVLAKAINDKVQKVRDIADLYTFTPPEKVYKKCRDGIILVCTIPPDAIVRGKAGRKCRASKAKIIDIIDDADNVKVGISYYNSDINYHIGDEIEIEDFDLSAEECSTGFHFFCTLDEARQYKYY